MISNKRGVSQVVTTVLVIMLTVVAVAAISAFVIPFVRDSLDDASSCVGISELYTFDEAGYNCYESLNGDERIYAFSVKTRSDKDTANRSDSFKIVLTRADGTSKVLDVEDNVASDEVRLVGVEDYGILTIPGPGEIKSYKFIDGGDKFANAELYAVVDSDKICENEKERIIIRACSNDKVIE